MRAPRTAVVAVASASCLLLPPAAQADSPARERELTCSDGTVFTGEQVRHGNGRPPSVWRGVTPGGDPVAFVFHAVTVTAPDGTVDEAETWDNTSGAHLSHELTTCSFVIPVGPLTGHQADFVGSFVPILGETQAGLAGRSLEVRPASASTPPDVMSWQGRSGLMAPPPTHGGQA